MSQVIKDQSFGIFPIRRGESQGIDVFMIQQVQGHWGLPKGHADGQESGQEAAVRELYEETGLRPVVFEDLDPLIESYAFQKGTQTVSKNVLYYIAWVEGKEHLQQEEIAEGQWVPIERAEHQATYRGTKEVCALAKSLLCPES